MPFNLPDVVRRRDGQKYRSEWEKEHSWIRPVSWDENKANCTICNIFFSISGGLTNVRQHLTSRFHIEKAIEKDPQSGIEQLLLNGDSLRKNCYRTEWERVYSWVSPVTGDGTKAKCTICDKIFSISGGLGKVKEHLNSKLHIKRSVEQKQHSSGINHMHIDTNDRQQKKNHSDPLVKDANPKRSRTNVQETSPQAKRGIEVHIDLEDSNYEKPTAKKAKEIHIDLDDFDEKPIMPLLQPTIAPSAQNSVIPSAKLPSSQPVSVAHNSAVGVDAPQKQKHILVVPNHHQSVMSNLSSLWKAGKLCDAIISNGTVNVKVHKMIFGAVCPQVLDIFYNTPQHKFAKVTFPNSISKEALLAFAEYMYNGVLDLDLNLLTQMKVIAERLNMDAFGKLCNNQLESLLPQNITPTSMEPVLSEPCSSSGLIEKALCKCKPSQVKVNAPTSNRTHQNDTHIVNSNTANNTQNVSLSDFSLVEVNVGTDDNLMDVRDNNLVFSAAAADNIYDMNMPNTNLMKVEIIDPEDQQYGRGAVPSGIECSTSYTIVTNNFPYFSTANSSQSSSTSQYINSTCNNSLNVNHVWTQNNQDRRKIDAVTNPTDPYPINVLPTNWANVSVHTQEFKKEYNAG